MLPLLPQPSQNFSLIQAKKILTDAETDKHIKIILKYNLTLLKQENIQVYQVWNIVGHHGWPTKKIFHFKSSKRARKT